MLCISFNFGSSSSWRIDTLHKCISSSFPPDVPSLHCQQRASSHFVFCLSIYAVCLATPFLLFRFVCKLCVCVPWCSLINWYLSHSCSGDGVQWCHTACCACRQIELPSCIDCITHLLVRAGGLSFSKYCLPPLCWFAHWNVIFNSSSNSSSRNGSRKQYC